MTAPLAVAPWFMKAGFTALGLAYLLPGHYLPWPSFEPQTMAALGMALLATAALLVARKDSFRPGLLGWIALALCLQPAAQWLTGQVPYRSDALLSVLYLVGFALCVCAGRALAGADPEGPRAALLNALALSAGLSAAITWGQCLEQSVVPMSIAVGPGQRPFGNLGQPNHLATLMALGMIGTLDAFERRRLGATVTGLVLAFMGGALLMTQSRAGWVALLVVTMWLLLQRKRLNLRVTPSPAIGFALVFSGLSAAWPSIMTLLKLGAVTHTERIQSGTRLLHWETLLDAALRRPWSGWGWGQVSVAQLAAANDHRATMEQLSYSHNAVLDLVVWCGIPLGLAVAASVVFWFWRRAHQCRTPGSFTLLAAFMAVGVHALVEFPLAHTYFLLPWALMIGMLDAGVVQGVPTARDVPVGPWPGSGGWPLPRAVGAGLLALTTAVASWVVLEYVQVDASTRAVRLQLAGIVGPSNDPEPPPQVLLLDGPREFHRFITTTARSDLSVAELEWMKQVMQASPSPPVMLRYALAAGLNHRPEEATATLAALCKIHPAKRCEEGRTSWLAAQQQHPELSMVPVPALPPEAGSLLARSQD